MRTTSQFPCLLSNMRVMAEKKDLGLTTEISEHFERRA